MSSEHFPAFGPAAETTRTLGLLVAPVKLAAWGAVLVGMTLVGSSLTWSQSPTTGWSQFRGPNGTGRSAGTTAVSFTDQTLATWTAKLPGVGNGSPVVWNDQLYVQCGDPENGQQILQCRRLSDGEVLWSKSFPGNIHRTHAWGSLASCTPVVDDTRVYCVWGSPQQTTLCALTHEGEQVWQRELGPNRFEHGFGSSPTLIDGRLIFFHSQDAATDPDQSPRFSRMLAFDPATGETLWETPLEKTTRVCYGVPIAVPLGDEQVGIVAANTGHGIFCLDAATGKLLWEQAVIKQRVVAGAIEADGLILASSGSGGGGNQLVALRLEDQTEAYRISRNANYVPMPVVVDDYLFLPNDKGILTCCRLADGEILNQRRLAEGRFGLASSLVAVGKQILAVSDEGIVKVIAADENLREIATLTLGEGTRATPALLPDGVLFRTESQLHAFLTRKNGE
jgi:outer membrane protein assembly factor BamB